MFSSSDQSSAQGPAPRAAAGPARRRPARRSSRLSDDAVASYAFLSAYEVAPETLARAVKVARRWRCPPHAALIALGWMSAEAYAGALAHHLGIGLRSMPDDAEAEAAAAVETVDALAARPDEIAAIVAALRAGGHRPMLGLAAVEARGRRPEPSAEDAVLVAAEGLKRRRPAESAASAMWLWQRLAVAMAFGLVAGGAVVAPGETLAVMLGLLALPFLLVTGLRVLSVLHLILPGWRISDDRAGAVRLADEVLPIYTVLVPLPRDNQGETRRQSG